MRSISPRGALTPRKIGPPARPGIRTVRQALWHGQRWMLWRPGMFASVLMQWQRENAENFQRSIEQVRRFERGTVPLGVLWGAVLRPDGKVMDLGLMSCRVVTDAGVGFLIDSLQGLVEPELMRYHGLGTSSAAENVNQTALTTELTTQYTPANTRATGSQGEKAGDPKTYETVATNTMAAGATITEHGIFSQAATGGGVLMDRSVFTGVPLSTSESLATTYQYTLPSGS